MQQHLALTDEPNLLKNQCIETQPRVHLDTVPTCSLVNIK